MIGQFYIFDMLSDFTELPSKYEIPDSISELRFDLFNSSGYSSAYTSFLQHPFSAHTTTLHTSTQTSLLHVCTDLESTID